MRRVPLPRHFAAVGELRLAYRPVTHLRMQETEAAGHVHVQAHFLHLGAVDGGHVDGKANGPLGQIIDKKLGSFERDRLLGLGCRGTKVRRHDHVG